MNLSSVVALWSAKFDVESALEVIVGDGPSACDDLVMRGARVTVVRGSEDVPDARVDLVVVHGAAPPARDPGAWLAEVAKRASKLVVVGAPDPDGERSGRLRGWAMRALRRARKEALWGATRGLAPVLWRMGRVREHERTGRATHAFVVDVTPRTPQARRKLKVAGAA